MPTILTHALLPLIGAAAAPRARLSKRLVAAGMIAAALPDADVIVRSFGVPHTHDFGHRGATHTILFAILVAIGGWLAARPLRSSPTPAFLFVLLSTLSHPLTDMLTSGGKGIMLYWPLEHVRFKFLFHPVEASPVGLQGIESGAIWHVLLSEALWLLLPALLLAFFCRWALYSHVHPPRLIDSGNKHT